MQFQQSLHPCFVQFQWVPGRVGQQVLQAFKGGSCNHVRDGLTRLMGQIAEQSGHLALHAVSARVSAEQRGKGLQESRQFG
jgi:hypothetical protein